MAGDIYPDITWWANRGWTCGYHSMGLGPCWAQLLTSGYKFNRTPSWNQYVHNRLYLWWWTTNWKVIVVLESHYCSVCIFVLLQGDVIKSFVEGALFPLWSRVEVLCAGMKSKAFDVGLQMWKCQLFHTVLLDEKKYRYYVFPILNFVMSRI